MKYLRRINDNCLVLDHRLNPMVSAMFSAMASRLPTGGIEARYLEVVEAIDAALVADANARTEEGTWRTPGDLLWNAEHSLTDLELHPIVQGFFDKFVGKYGHASIMECTGQPAVYVEGVSLWTAYLSFDNPLVIGQEFSTRAMRKKDWPMCREAMIYGPVAAGPVGADDDETPEAYYALVPHPELAALHDARFAQFDAEVEAQKVELRLPCPTCKDQNSVKTPGGELRGCQECDYTGRKYPFIKDPQSFRPALDRARWAIPGTASTGFCHSANVRVMGRGIKQGQDFCARKCEWCGWKGEVMEGDTCLECMGFKFHPSQVWGNIQGAYEAALPGMAGMWSKEAVAGGTNPLPAHLQIKFIAPGEEVQLSISSALPLELEADYADVFCGVYRRKPRGYLDPTWNQLVQVHIEFQCSWAVARDWHRHRTAFPWHLNIVRNTEEDSFRIHSGYTSLTTTPGERARLMDDSFELFDKFRTAGDMEKAMLCLSLGTLVSMRTTMGLRDAVYMLELRANAHGANFEYEAQAKEALLQLKAYLGRDLCRTIFPGEPNEQ